MSTVTNEILEHNVHELTEQLYASYKRIKKQQEEIQSLHTVIDALAHEASERFKQN